MIDLRPDAMAANRGTEVPAAPRPAGRTVRFWLLGVTGALALTVCAFAFLLWGIYGPAYLLDLIAAYCG